MSTTAAAAAVAAAAAQQHSTTAGRTAMKWAVSSWAFFIAENAILSENRTTLIAWLDHNEEVYHAIYGSFSTAAVASILYTYRYKLRSNSSSSIATAMTTMSQQLTPIKTATTWVSSWMLLSTGLVMAFQSLPKLQIPVAFSRHAGDNAIQISDNAVSAAPSANAVGSWKLQVRCPFDFTDRHVHHDDDTVRGLERISRHPGLWGFAFLAASQAVLIPALRMPWYFHPQARQVWWMGPTAVAWLGGAHTDSRYRRGIGGTLDPAYDSQTSNLPLAACLSGRQGSVGTVLQKLVRDELKPLNSLVGVSVATFIMMVRFRATRKL